MIQDIFEFIRKEKIYAILFVLVCAFLVLEHWESQKTDRVFQESPVLENFRAAEKQLHEEMQQEGAFKNFLEERPRLYLVFQVLSAFLTLAFVLGLILDYMLLTSSDFRGRWVFQLPTPFFDHWKFSMLFKVIILFLTAGFLCSWVMGVVRRLAAPQLSLNFYLITHTAITDVLCLFFIVAIIRRAGANMGDIGFRIPSGKVGREIMFGFGGYLILLPIFVMTLFVVVVLSEWLAKEPPVHPLVNIFLEEDKRSTGLVWFSILLATIIGPFFEEVFFRGFCYPILKKRFGIAASAVATSAFFALIHENTFAFWPIFVLGLGLVWIYEKRKSLLAPITLHIFHNSVFIGYFFLMKNVIAQETGM